MAKRHPAEDEIGQALALLSQIETAAVELPLRQVLRETIAADQPVSQGEPVAQLPATAARLRAMIDEAGAPGAPLASAVRRLDSDTSMVIARAGDTEVLKFHEKILRKLRFSRLPQDVRRHDGVLVSRLLASIERSAQLMSALEVHRPVIRKQLADIEQMLVVSLDATKTADSGTAPTDDAVERLENLQEIGEALIRHTAICNGLFHKLSIEAERAIVVLHALTKGDDVALADRLTPAARVAFSQLLDLSDMGMLSMREIERRKRGVDESFSRVFPHHSARRIEEDNTMPASPAARQQASA